MGNKEAGLLSSYKKRRHEIKKRLDEFRGIHKGDDKSLFRELCFCICTPQSNALFAYEAINELANSGFLFKGSTTDIRPKLQRVRFPNNKTSYLLKARELFKNGKGLDIRNRLDLSDVFKAREWLAKNIKGLGYKEASHFLRNIGLGRDIAILDVHILRNLKKHRVISRIPTTISKKTYLAIENRMRTFSKKIGISLEEMDLLFWSNQTGFVFR